MLKYQVIGFSKKFTTINTHKDLFQYNRLPFGIASAPSISQRAMNSLVQGLPHVSAYLDDILVSGVDEEDHLNNLDKVLQRLESAGLTLKKSMQSVYWDLTQSSTLVT